MIETAHRRVGDPIDWVAEAARADPEVASVDTGGQDYAVVWFVDGSFLYVYSRAHGRDE